MIAREDLHHLVEELPEGELLPAERFLKYLLDRAKEPPKAREIHVTGQEGRVRRMLSPRFVNPEDAARFRVKVTILDKAAGEKPDATL